MSAGKKKTGVSRLQELHASILDLVLEHLTAVKPFLDNPQNLQWSSMTEKLIQIASLAELFTEQRPKSSRSTWSHLADSLDQEGVGLWNISGLISKALQSENDGHKHVASVRLAAFRLVEAGLEGKPGLESALIHVLQMANKTAMGLSETGNNVHAASVLTSAAKLSKFEEQLQNANDTDDANRKAIACVTVMYYSSRMEAAWKEGNDSLAQYMSRKIMDDNQRLSLLPAHARELLSSKFHQIGKAILGNVQDAAEGANAVQWLQWAFCLVDQLEESAAIGVPRLKVSWTIVCYSFSIQNWLYVRRRSCGRWVKSLPSTVALLSVNGSILTLARAYFLSGAYDRAESVLDELVPALDSSQDHATSEYQELRWLRLAVLRRRKAGDGALLDAFKSIVDHMELSEGSITEILQDLRALNQHHTLVTAVHQHCMEKALLHYTTASEHVHRLLLCLIIHASKDEDHARAMKTLNDTFKAVCDAEVELPGLVCTACMTLILVQLLWQYAGRQYKSKKWSEAAQWYLAGSHGVFKACGHSSSAKCFRKAALCHIEEREYSSAANAIRRCPTNEAATHYIIFLTAIHQGLENEAIRAIQDMLKAPDFDRKMLLLATQISHQSEMKSVLLAVLESLLRTLKIGTSGEVVVEAMTLMRCIVKLILNLFSEPAANRPALIETVVNQFRTARLLTQTAASQRVVPLVYKDISWLWRTAYNCAVQGCADWENAGEQISELFDIAREMLECCRHASPVDNDVDLSVHLANATFAAVSGRVFSARELMSTTGVIDEGNLRVIAAEIKKAQVKINDIGSKKIIQESQDNECIQYFVYALRVFQAEFATYLKNWDQLSQEIDEITQSGPLAVGTYEAIADFLVSLLSDYMPTPSEKHLSFSGSTQDVPCMVILYKCLEAILRGSLDHKSLSVEKFSRWLRAICTISLARDTSADRLKAIGYVEHAVRVIEDHHGTEEVRIFPLAFLGRC
ncbi:hypothetical protein CVT26_008401 [Gymnopilus dilepis]|uniref:Protein ZIP4 homolog n=1 Tax=Gymnopilus dilepis TaxID=231916 RepID=A0A409Y950_9AGAR|nr:hypothetical protein CVT26_008401 [Gymnopilus dilepis]